MKAAGSFIVVFSLALIAGCVAHVSEKALIRPTQGQRLSATSNSDGQWTIQSTGLTQPDGVNLYAAYFSRPDSKALVLEFGGNVFTIGKEYRGAFARLLMKIKQSSAKNNPGFLLSPRVTRRVRSPTATSFSLNDQLKDS